MSKGIYTSAFAGCPADWDIVPFAEAVDFREGPGIMARDFREDGVPLLRLRNIERPFVDLTGCNFLDPDMVAAKWDHFRLQTGDLLLSTSGTLGRVSIATNRSLNSIPYTGIIRMRPAHPGIDAGFIRYFLTSPLFQQQAEASAAGSVLKHFGPSHLREMSFPVPPIHEQRAVANVLSALDDKIEQNRSTARTLGKLAQTIFRAWFVDFEPVKAKAAGATSFPSMPQVAFDSLPTTFTDSELGLIPKGWTMGTIGTFADLSKTQIKPQNYAHEIFDHFSIPAFDAGMQPRTEPGRTVKSNKFLVSEGSVLLSKLNPRTPRVWLPSPAGERRQITSTEFMVLEPVLSSDRYYLYCQCQVREFSDNLAQRASGTSNSHQRVRPQDLMATAATVPPATVRDQFNRIADPIFSHLLAIGSESAKLAEMRDYLLPKLLSGEVRVDPNNVRAEVPM